MLKSQKILIVHNIRSSENVGSMFRTAEASGVDKVYLTGYTPAPIDRFQRINKKLIKTSLGAEEFLAWQQFKDINKLLKKLKADDFYLVALEQDPSSKNYKKAKLPNQTAIIVGNEVSGLSKNLLAKVDAIFEIPMRGKKESLNVSVALGVFLFETL